MMRIKHSVFARYVLVNTYSKARIECYDGEYCLSLQWGVNGPCVCTYFCSLISLGLFVRKLPDGRAKRVFLDCHYVSYFLCC